ncbi:BglG family transcription antiterminator [Paenibacillus allorhizosphaerae]|uniref:Transcriptional regulator MtlR n=1 Tax=Paenibacillus allorhizosphaerae TaxID=2849866 RepID=A0ABN7TSI3_9BACL|nr:BglG family transcription antiterminator [Paenibacillus allorhizosphaerae]CAG7654022.1 Transcriptional regulator MtlR [Paenibacillus allorhizosphaerae]
MSISSRTRRIIELLLRSDQELTAAHIAAEIQMSSRTVHRELATVEDILHEHGVELFKKSGLGIRLHGDESALARLAQLVSVSEDIEFSPEERQLYVICLLLESIEPIKLYALAHELKVTVPTISSDLDELDGFVHKFGVVLTRRRGYGVELSGPEEQLRDMIRQLIQLRIDDTELIATREEHLVHPLDRQLFALAGKSEMEAVETILWSWEEKWAGRLSENSYTELLIRLSIALRRIRAGKTVVAQYAAEQGTVLASHREADAIYLTGLLSERMQLALSPAESAYISRLLRLAQAEDLSLLPADDLALTEKVRLLIQYVQGVMGADYGNDRSLREGLFYHMKDALQRLNDGQNIRNPLLDQIKKDYTVLFGIVREAADRVLSDVVVPDEEVGFLVMHFGASLERLKQLRRDVRAILVCSSGIGSSKLLQIRLQKELPQIQIVGRVSWYEASRTEKDKYDLIISTVDLPLDPGQYMKVSPLLTEGEADRLRSFVQAALDRKRTEVFIPEDYVPSEVSAFERLLSLKTTLDEMVNLIAQFKVIRLDEQSGELPLILHEACRYEEARGVLTDASLVTQRLVQREQSGSQIIPGTEVALFHTRSEEITRSSLSLYRLGTPLMVDTEPRARLSQFLLMLAPRTLPKEILEVLSEISAMLLDTEMIDLLETGEEAEIRDYLTIHLKIFFNTKTEASEM